jgi:hypothetical protein
VTVLTSITPEPSEEGLQVSFAGNTPHNSRRQLLNPLKSIKERAMKALRVLAVTVVLLFLVSLGFGQKQGRTEHYSYPITVRSQNLGSCEAFDVYTDYDVMLHVTAVYDNKGNLAKERFKADVVGRSIYYNSNNPTIFLMGGPGEMEIDHLNIVKESIFATGLMWKVTVPGYGAIFLETGRLVWDFNIGENLYNTGHNQFFDEDLKAVCKALTPP